MNEEMLRIQKMVAEGKVTPQESIELMDSLPGGVPDVRTLDTGSADTGGEQGGANLPSGAENPPSMTCVPAKLKREVRWGGPLGYVLGGVMAGLSLLTLVVELVKGKLPVSGLLMLGLGLAWISYGYLCAKCQRVFAKMPEGEVVV